MKRTVDEAAISVKGLGVQDARTGVSIIDEVSFELRPGEIVSLLGPSGSGKSTTALAVMGLLRPPLLVSSGTAVLGGEKIDVNDPVQLSAVRGRRLSMIFQDPFSSLNPVLPCGVQAEEPLRIHTDVGGRQRRERVLDRFREVGFDEPDRIYRSLPSQLSGGQLQRVMLAMATILGPTVLLADEPTTALDPEAQEGILGLLAKMRERHGMAILLITHDLDLARTVSDRVLRMQDGRLLEGDGQVERHQDKAPTGVRRVMSGGASRAPLLSVRGLSKTFVRGGIPGIGRRRRCVKTLADIDFDLARGEILGIIGPSGSGKTTLGRCISGLTTPDQGEIILEGKPVDAKGKRRGASPVQMVYQNPYASLNPVMRIGESVEEGPRAEGMPSGERRELAVRLLKQVGLSPDFYSRLPGELSGGERQRAVIARALATEPRLLVADEPTASLDVQTGIQVLDLLKRLTHEIGLGVLLISHDRKTIARVSDRVMALHDGKLVAVTTV